MKYVFWIYGVFYSSLMIGQTRVGISLGVGISDKFNDEKRTSHMAFGEQNAQIGTLISIDSETFLNETWYISGGLNYTNFSFAENVNMAFVDPEEELLELCDFDGLPNEGIASIKHRFSFLQLPVVINYVFANCKECGWKWNVGVGPSFDLSLNHKVKTPLLEEGEYLKADCLVRQSVILGINAQIGTTYEFMQNDSQLRFTLFYNRQFQPIYQHPLNYNLGMTGIKVTYLFAFKAFK